MFPWVDLATLIPFIPASFWQMFIKSNDDGDKVKAKKSFRTFIWNSLAQFIVICSFAAVTFGNLTTVPQLNLTASPWFTDTLRLFRLDQRWAMFAPDPIDFGGWFVMVGKLADGHEIDPFRLGRSQAPTWDKPHLVSTTYMSLGPLPWLPSVCCLYAVVRLLVATLLEPSQETAPQQRKA